MRTVRRIAAVIVGSVFFIAGMLKLMDPVGASLVVEEYLKFLHLRFLVPASGVAGSAMALFEAVLGTAMITGVWRRCTGIVTGVVLAFFTILTFVLWLLNPSMDCGCFGEAIHLTHLQSLVKNLVLCALWALAFLPLKSLGEPLKVKYVSFSIVAVSLCLFLLYSSLSIPLLDFTPFKPGEELQQSEDVELEDAPLLSFCDAEGEYFDELAARGNVVVASVYDPENISPLMLESVSAMFADASAASVTPILLIAGTPDQLDAMTSDPMLLMNSYFADRRTLMTLNRSNGGASYISDGQIVAKWAVRSLPSADKFAELVAKDNTESVIDENSPRRLGMQSILLYVFAVMLLL